jgi:hypothetical protein
VESELLLLALHVGLSGQEGEDPYRLYDIEDREGSGIVFEFEAQDLTYVGVHHGILEAPYEHHDEDQRSIGA